MAQLVEPYRPFVPAPSKRGILPAYRSVAPTIAAIGAIRQMRDQVEEDAGRCHPFEGCPHNRQMVASASEQRKRLLPYFHAADEWCCALNWQASTGIERKTAVVMVSAMLAALGIKGDKDTLAAMVNLIESDDIARASGEWKPLSVNATTLALACQSLIATCTFPPKPAELASACRKARNRVNGAIRFCEELREHAQRSDAVLLEFAPEEWRQTYSEPEYRKLVLPRMLDVHSIYGPRIDEDHFCYLPPSDDSNDDDYYVESERNRSFRLALTAARRSFPELPPYPSYIKSLSERTVQTIEREQLAFERARAEFPKALPKAQEPNKLKIAASAQSVPIKRSTKVKRADDGGN